MAVNFKAARDFVYSSGTLVERALFGWLFEDRPLSVLHGALRAYKNADGGWGHALEHDVRTPDSHPLALEFLLTMQRVAAFPIGDLLDGTPEWVLANQNPDGSLKNPASLLDYPHAPWWIETGGQTMPDSLVGNLARLGLCPPPLAEATRRWVEAHVSLQAVADNAWLFMAYHAYDYFFGVKDHPDLYIYRAAVLDNLSRLSAAAPDNQTYSVFLFATDPQSGPAIALGAAGVAKRLDYLIQSQRDDGAWVDQHELPQWYPWTTIVNLLALKRFGRLNP